MVKSRITSIFFLLLKSGLWKDASSDSDYFPLSEGEWEEIYKISINQTVECIVFDGVQKLEPNNQPPRHILLNWAVRVEKQVQRNDMMNDVILDLQTLFASQDITPILLKGQGLATCYENPMRRVCGDIDLFFEDKKSYLSAFEIINSKGLEIASTPGFSAEYIYDKFEVEHHQKMFDIHNPFVQHVLDRIRKEEVHNYKTLSIKNTEIKLPSAIETIIQANCHILKHLLSFGIGIRQLCDSARIYFHYHVELSKQDLKSIYSKLGIKKWVDLLHQLLVEYIGLEEDKLPYPLIRTKNADWMMEDILIAGNFGFHNEKFKEKENSLNGDRANKKSRIWNSFVRYVQVTPSEAIWFPIMQYYSRIFK